MNGSLDHWHSLSLLAAGQGLFLSVALLLVRSPDQKNKLLATLMLLFSASLVDNVWFWSGYYLDFPHLLGISMAFPFLYGPLIYNYTKEALKAGAFNLHIGWKHFVLPGIVLLYLSHYYLASAEGKLILLESWFQSPINSILIPVAGLASLVFYVVQTYRLFQGVPGWQASSGKAGNWLYRIFLSYALFVALFLLNYGLLSFKASSPASDYAIAFGAAFFIYFIGYLGFSKSKLLNGIKVQELKYQSSTITTTAGEHLLNEVKRHLEHTKAYTNNQLRLGTLAHQVGITSHQLSQVVNEHARSSFPDFINAYRIQEAKRRLIKEDTRINQLAIDVGFNNKTTFNLAFKKFVGCSPSEFRKGIN